MLLENEGEILSMTVMETYSGQSPIVIDNDDKVISLDISALSGQLSGDFADKETVDHLTACCEQVSGAISSMSADKQDKLEFGYDSNDSISSINGSALFAQSAYSASVATNDSLGRNISETYLTAVDLSNYYTKNETSGADELANAFNNIPSGDTEVNNTVHTYSGDWNSTYTTVNSNSATWSQNVSFTGVTTDSTLTGDGLNSQLGVADIQTLSSDTSISITTAANGVILGVNSSWFDNAVNSAVTGTQGDAEVNAAVHNNSATWNTVTNKLDSTAFSTVSGNFLTAHQDLSNYVTETDLESTSATITAMIPSTAGLATETDLQIVSAGVDYISGVALTSVDLTPYLTTATYAADSGTFATTSMLNDYQTTAGMTAYASTGDISGTQWNSVYDTVEANSARWGAGSTYTGDAQGALDEVYSNSGNWNDVYTTVYNNSGSWTGGGGGSIDTIPFIVQSPLTTGISGYSAYIGLDGEAFESSAYVPFSALTDNGMSDGYVHMINNSGLYASDAEHSNVADYAYYDNNGNDLATTRYYAEEAYNTVQSNSASWSGGGTPVSGLELSAGDYITIVDDIPNSASIISVTGLATTGDLNYVSGVVGDVESLLAQL